MKPNIAPTLWERVEAFSIDDPRAGIKFSDKLAFQNHWTPAFTANAIAEYKKFIFLCCISSTGASPSNVVDEVWHLHLTYTHNYWKEFCGAVLQQEIHHHPSKGGAAEDDKHRNWYAETLALYKNVFDEDPPSDVWPPVAGNGPTALQPLNDSPAIDYTAAYKKHGYLLLLPFLFPFGCGKLHPFALKGPQFLLFYGILFAAAFGYLIAVRRYKLNAVRGVLETINTADAGPFQKARFVFGREKAIQTAIVDLVAKGILIAEPRERFSFYPAKVDAPTRRENPLAANLLRRHSGSQPLLMKDAGDYYDESLTEHEGLALLYKTVVKKDWLRAAVCGGVLLLGLVRTAQGLNSGYPVAYLQAMMMIGAFVFIAVLSGTSSEKLLQTVFTDRYKDEELTFSGTEGLLQKFVFLGVAAFAGAYAFEHLELTFRSNRTAHDSGTSSGCGSSGWGSSCGSGCGGGCGGCGGGD